MFLYLHYRTIIQIKMFFNAGGSILCHRHFPTRPTIFPAQEEEDNDILEDDDSLNEDNYEEVFAHVRKETYANSKKLFYFMVDYF